jgi:hypothetical protein
MHIPAAEVVSPGTSCGQKYEKHNGVCSVGDEVLASTRSCRERNDAGGGNRFASWNEGRQPRQVALTFDRGEMV